MQVIINKKFLTYLPGIKSYKVTLLNKVKANLKVKGKCYVIIPSPEELEPYETVKGKSEYTFWIELPQGKEITIYRENSSFTKIVSSKWHNRAWAKRPNAFRYASTLELKKKYLEKKRIKAFKAARKKERAKEAKAFKPKTVLRKALNEPRRCITCGVYLDITSHALQCGFCKSSPL